MTREQANDLVEELLQASHDYEILGGKSYRDHLMEQKAKVVDALMTVEPQMES